jgi:hypothetical protein
MLNHMTEMEQRIFELFGDRSVQTPELIKAVRQEFDVSEDVAFDAARRVLRLYGTPNLAIAREALDRLDKIIPYI